MNWENVNRPPKRTRARFETEQQILKAIDKAKGEADYHQKLSASLYADSKLAWRKNYRAEAQQLEDRAKAADVKASQLIQITLKRLGERLSEFRTARMPFLEDESIPR